MKMTNQAYSEYVKMKSPNSPLWKNMFKAFLGGGLICAIGQGFLAMYQKFGLEKADAGTAASITLIFLGAVLTGLKVYDKLAGWFKAGSLIPITGFSNSMVSPALEFKSEGYISGTAAKMFIIAGPVIVFGVSASAVYGILYCIFK